MAFSTQKDFFSIPLMDEKFEEDCKKSCVGLKSYESTADERAWARDEKVQSRYLTDLLACEASPFERLSEEIEGDLGKADAGATAGPGNVGVGLGASPSAGDSLLSHLGSMAGGDSLLEAANMRLEEYQKLLNINTKLEHELNLSNERLKTATDENRKIREILDSRLDDSTCKDFYNKVQQLTKAGKLNRNEENEMLQIHKRLDHLLKAYDITRAENNHLRRIIEKMSNRCNLEKIKTEPEQSKDVRYLQQEVNKLRKECLMLRGMEDEYQRMRQQIQQQEDSGKSISDRDAETIKAIIRERNSLRDKLKSFNQKVGDMQKKAKSLSYDLEHQSKYCANVEAEMLKMQKYYEDQMQQAGFQEECLKAQLEDMKEQLMEAKCMAQKTDMLQMEASCLRNEILKRDMALSDYDCQYKQLMHVVEELQYKEQRGAEGDVCKTDELAFFTQATLNEIAKELTIKKQRTSQGSINEVSKELMIKKERTSQGSINEVSKELMIKKERTSQGSQASLCAVSENFQDKLEEMHERCNAELNNLKEKLKDMQAEQMKAANCEKLCADAMERLEKLQDINDQLEKELENANFQNIHLNRCLKECNGKTSNMLEKLNAMEEEIKKHAKDSDDIGEGLNNTMKLVQDISDIQMKNNQLASAVNALNTRDDQKIIDDLRKQLEDTMNRLNKCQEANQELEDNLQDRDNSLKKLKDLNNQLEAEKSKMKEALKEAEKRMSEPPGTPRTPETGGLVTARPTGSPAVREPGKEPGITGAQAIIAPGAETRLTGPQAIKEPGTEARVTGAPAISAREPGRPGEGGPGERGPGAGGPREGGPGAGGPKEAGPGAGIPGEGGPGAIRPEEGRAGAEKPGERRPGEPGAEAPAISARGPLKPGEGGPRERGPGAGGPREGGPGAGGPKEAGPGAGIPGEGGPGAIRPEEGRAGAGKPGEPGAEAPAISARGPLKPGEGGPRERGPGAGGPREGGPGAGGPRETAPGAGIPGEGGPGAVRPEEGGAGAGKPGEQRPGSARPGEGKPGEELLGAVRPGAHVTGPPATREPGTEAHVTGPAAISERGPGEIGPGEEELRAGRPGERRPGSPRPGEEGPGTGKRGEELLGAVRPGARVTEPGAVSGRGHGEGGPGEGGPGAGRPGEEGPSAGKPGEDLLGAGRPSARVTGPPAMSEPGTEASVTGPSAIRGRGTRGPEVGASGTGAPDTSGATRGAPGLDVPRVGDPGAGGLGAGGPGAAGPGTRGPGEGDSGVGEPRIGGPIPWSPGAGEGPGGPEAWGPGEGGPGLGGVGTWGAGKGEPGAFGPGEGGFRAGPPGSGRPETRPGAPGSAKMPVSPLALTIHESAISGEKTGRRELAPSAKMSGKKVIKPKPGDEAHLDAFVEKTVGKMRGVGSYFERDLRKILDEFIQECGFCFCRLVNPRSNLYSIAHKLYHYGIATLSFRELAYVHKKLYSRADQILPGCLLDMIVKEHTLEVKSILGCICERLKSDHISKNREEEQRKCCCCKSELCCNNSEDDFKEKVIKLERDIEDAKGYLEGLRAMPYKSCLDQRDSVAETPNSTFRASSSHQSRSTKQLKKLKSRFVKRDDY